MKLQQTILLIGMIAWVALWSGGGCLPPLGQCEGGVCAEADASEPPAETPDGTSGDTSTSPDGQEPPQDTTHDRSPSDTTEPQRDGNNGDGNGDDGHSDGLVGDDTTDRVGEQGMSDGDGGDGTTDRIVPDSLTDGNMGDGGEMMGDPGAGDGNTDGPMGDGNPDAIPPELRCTTGITRPCTTGMPGVCKDGLQICTASRWGTCQPNQQASAEVCDDSKDNDCDGTVDEGCAWTRKLPSTLKGYDLVVDKVGDAYIAGSFSGAINLSSTVSIKSKGAIDAFVAKVNAKNEVQWAVSWGGSANDISTDVYVTPDGKWVYVTGTYRGTITVGSTTLSPQDFDPSTKGGNDDIFLAKLKAQDGSLQWIVNIGSESYNSARDVVADNQGTIYLAMTVYQKKLVLSPNHKHILISSTYNIQPFHDTSKRASSDGLLLKLIERPGVTTKPVALAWVTHISAQRPNNNCKATPEQMALHPNGTLTLLGNRSSYTPLVINGSDVTPNNNSNNKEQAFFLQPNTLTGAVTKFGLLPYQGGEIQGYDVETDAAQNIYIAGNFKGTITLSTASSTTSITSATSGYYDAFVVKMNSSFQAIWANRAGSTSHSYGGRIQVGASGDVFFMGHAHNASATTLGPHATPQVTLPSVGSTYNVFVARLNASGLFQWAYNAYSNGSDAYIGLGLSPVAPYPLTVFARYAGKTFTNGNFKLSGSGSSAFPIAALWWMPPCQPSVTTLCYR